MAYNRRGASRARCRANSLPHCGNLSTKNALSHAGQNISSSRPCTPPSNENSEAEVEKALADLFHAQTDKNGCLDVEGFIVAQAALARVLGYESDRALDMAACLRLMTTQGRHTIQNKFCSWQRERLVYRGVSASRMAEVLRSVTEAITGRQHSKTVCAGLQRMPQTRRGKSEIRRSNTQSSFFPVDKDRLSGMQSPASGKQCDPNLSDLFGPTLLSRSCEEGVAWTSFDTAEALAGRGAVALYFSAHWCPPCRRFTPQLADWYDAQLKARGLEIVFVSSDKDWYTFQSYYKQMPWLAIPFDDHSRKQALKKRFKVVSIPTLVILGPDGEVITKEGLEAISRDPVGFNFPWRPKSLKEVLSGAKLICHNERELVSADSLENKCLAFYFSASWCPPCRAFTKQLANWYTKKLKAKGLEVVFVSSDRDAASFKEYFNEMPWLALDFSDLRREELSCMFGVSGIPTLVIIGSDGKVITKDGRAAVSNDPEGEMFPWYPKAVADLKAGPGSLPDVPTVIAFCEGSSPEVQMAAVNAMTPLAERVLQEQKAEDREEPRFGFMVATTLADGVAGIVREITGLPPDAQVPRLMLIDFADGGAFYSGPEGPITADSVEKFVLGYESNSLQRRQLPAMPLGTCWALGIKESQIKIR